ncbi:MAG TPA: MFS transporter [Streptosporangiaceae bacterium]|nr:MFS transporter [Streptosporangiaceae bacterium]
MDGAARTAGSRTLSRPGQPTFREVFAVGEFRALWLAQLLSVAGDQVARVAMTVLVFDRTHSALWTALTYAVTFLPWMIGGLTLSGLADRRPRSEVMVACDAGRMVLVFLMALVSLKSASAAALWIMVALLFGVTLLDSPFKSARSAMMPDVLPGERYVLGTAVTQTTLQVGLVSGFALGGLVVAVLGVRAALLVDAATFAASAVLIRLWVRHRPSAADPAAGSRSQFAEMAAGVRLVFGDRRLRTLMLLGWLVAFYVVPMGLAAPYAASFHTSLAIPVSTGLVFAAGPFGTALGAVVLGRRVPQAWRERLMGPLAIATCGVLLLCWIKPGLVAALLIIAGSGACASYQLAANAAFVASVPPDRRGQAFGLANGGMQVTQGLWIVLAGAAASSSAISPGIAIAISGGLGAVLAAALAIGTRRQPTNTGIGL